MIERQNLDGIQVGDTIAVCWANGDWKAEVVTAVTQKQVLVGTTRFWIAEGSRVGDANPNNYSYARAYPMNEQKAGYIAQRNAEVKRRDDLGKVRNLAQMLTDAELATVSAMIAAHQKA
jgi:hypothetical protein